jgi:hypothetical protein
MSGAGASRQDGDERRSTAPPPREDPDHTEEPSRKQSDQLPEEYPAGSPEESDDDADEPSTAAWPVDDELDKRRKEWPRSAAEAGGRGPGE